MAGGITLFLVGLVIVFYICKFIFKIINVFKALVFLVMALFFVALAVTVLIEGHSG